MLSVLAISRTVRCFQASDGLFSHATCPDIPAVQDTAFETESEAGRGEAEEGGKAANAASPRERVIAESCQTPSVSSRCTMSSYMIRSYSIV